MIRERSFEMKDILIIVDMQTDFIDGSLGSAEAVDIIPNAVKRIREWQGDIIVTLDTHSADYLETAEGKKLPVPHCIKGTKGWALHPLIEDSLSGKCFETVEKPTFGSTELPDRVRSLASGEDFSLTLIGLCTDICVVSNALLLKAAFPEKRIAVDASCCAGVSPQTHEAALRTMQSCQIDILNYDL